MNPKQLLCATSAIVALGACSRSPGPTTNNAANAVTAAPGKHQPASSADVDAANHQLLAAAEPFENLTESAFSAKPAKLSKMVSDAQSAAQSVLPSMPAQAAGKLKSEVSDINAAQQNNDRANIALAAVEAYRTLVSNTTGQLTVPQQVSLLDYTGSRTQAALNASPPLWSDVSEAVQFGNARWQEIDGQVADKALAGKMDSALKSMSEYAQSKNKAGLMKVSTTELDLVDALEKYFTNTASAQPGAGSGR